VLPCLLYAVEALPFSRVIFKLIVAPIVQSVYEHIAKLRKIKILNTVVNATNCVLRVVYLHSVERELERVVDLRRSILIYPLAGQRNY